MTGQNIGRALSLVERYWTDIDMDEEFGHAMGAPMDELRSILNRGSARGFRRVKRRVHALTGLRWRAFCREVERRTSARWVHFNTQLGRERSMEMV